MNITKLITKIVDGDTINVEPIPDGEDSVRLLEIDIPETNKKVIAREDIFMISKDL